MSTTNKTDFQVVGTRPPRPDAVDKVLGKATFAADVRIPNALIGKVKRSPHAHARIVNIDISAALALPGVGAVVTAADFPALRPHGIGDLSRDNLANEKVLFHGHAVAAVAASSSDIADAALDLIKVDYEVLPVVLEIDDAMRDEVVLHNHLLSENGEPTNVYERQVESQGDVVRGFAQADVILEREYRTPTVHQGYIEPPACVADYRGASTSTIWTTTQGHFIVQQSVARMMSMDLTSLKVMPTEIGGGFGGKTAPYQEAIALMLSRRSGQPVKMVMTRQEIFRTAGPGAGARIRLKIGIRSDGTLTALQANLAYESGAFPAAPLGGGMRSIFAAYDVPNQLIEGCSVVVNKPKIRAYRGPGASQSTFATESLLNELADKLGMDPLALRLKNAVKEGSAFPGGKYKAIGLVGCLEAARQSEHYQSPRQPGVSRAIAAGFWRNGGNVSSANIQMKADGSVALSTGSTDLSGTRLALAMMAAEEFQVPVERVSAQVADTESVGFTSTSGGSRTINATGRAVLQASQEVITEMCQRAAATWNVTPEQVEWRAGAAVNLVNDESRSMKEICRDAPQTGGPISATASLNATPGESPSFAVHICDVMVDHDTGQTKIVRYTTIQDVGRAIHPDFVEGQMQGGAVQGIGWALNEAYCYDEQGVLENSGFLDYRIPLASDLPMIDTIIIEEPSPSHPYGVRGVGEVPIIPPLAAVASAISQSIGAPVLELPCSPPNVLKIIQERR